MTGGGGAGPIPIMAPRFAAMAERPEVMPPSAGAEPEELPSSWVAVTRKREGRLREGTHGGCRFVSPEKTKGLFVPPTRQVRPARTGRPLFDRPFGLRARLQKLPEAGSDAPVSGGAGVASQRARKESGEGGDSRARAPPAVVVATGGAGHLEGKEGRGRSSLRMERAVALG